MKIKLYTVHVYSLIVAAYIHVPPHPPRAAHTHTQYDTRVTGNKPQICIADLHTTWIAQW